LGLLSCSTLLTYATLFSSVFLAAAHLPDQAHHVRGAVGVVQAQPLAPDFLQLVRQAQQHVAGFLRAVPARGLEDVLELVVADHRDRKSTRLNSSHVKISYA